jgi:hypothetical protein
MQPLNTHNKSTLRRHYHFNYPKADTDLAKRDFCLAT